MTYRWRWLLCCNQGIPHCLMNAINCVCNSQFQSIASCWNEFPHFMISLMIHYASFAHMRTPELHNFSGFRDNWTSFSSLMWSLLFITYTLFDINTDMFLLISYRNVLLIIRIPFQCILMTSHTIGIPAASSIGRNTSSCLQLQNQHLQVTSDSASSSHAFPTSVPWVSTIVDHFQRPFDHQQSFMVVVTISDITSLQWNNDGEWKCVSQKCVRKSTDLFPKHTSFQWQYFQSLALPTAERRVLN